MPMTVNSGSYASLGCIRALCCQVRTLLLERPFGDFCQRLAAPVWPDPLPGIDSHTRAANTGRPVEALQGSGLLSVRLKRGRFLNIIGLRRG